MSVYLGDADCAKIIRIKINILKLSGKILRGCQAQLRRSQKRLAAQAIDIGSEVRSLRNRLVLQRNLIDHYRRTVLPLRKRFVDLRLKNNNYMLLGAFDLNVAKQQEFEAYQAYPNAVAIVPKEDTRANKILLA